MKNFNYYGEDQWDEIEEQARQDELYKRRIRRQLKQQELEETEGWDYEDWNN